jgi:hypothetical protein
MKDDTNFIAEESVTRLRATICELDELILGEENKTALTELQQLKDKITSVLQQLNEGV